MRGDAAKGVGVLADVEENRRSSENDARLEAATGSELSVQTDIETEDNGDKNDRHRNGAHSGAELRRVGDFAGLLRRRLLVAAQQHHDAEHGGEEDELFAQGVEAAIVVVDGVDGVGGVALVDGQVRDVVAVGAAILTPGRKVERGIAVKAEKDGASDTEEGAAGAVQSC